MYCEPAKAIPHPIRIDDRYIPEKTQFLDAIISFPELFFMIRCKFYTI
jgi:hypothetical protein